VLSHHAVFNPFVSSQLAIPDMYDASGTSLLPRSRPSSL
jgi:hypothetical protein